MIYSAQIRAARGLLDWSRDELVAASGLSRSTLQRMEAGDGIAAGHGGNLWQVQQALEAAGIIFLPADQFGGPGVRLKDPV
ncbi:helix-turn-helix transcriptional regulator [Parvibaculum sp.]|uniref:helix-turn-helix domain-containing protein n=2 Tax=Parvibaculum sp. TaxID=2024848 RepID=UPI001B20A159|nr:helix-turn-helix transcriptional regulator [Parvibaculum sp.]MBO6668029.1 helix-turn-helix transcriptional regulator [Parvibaculum sp.]MBO6715655.1 helix-turn-helix transcriptional regulator [Parvibaculum sp.]